MTGLIPILLLGALILILGGRLLVQWAKKGSASVITIDDYSAARATLDSVFVETAVIKRIFASEDMEFISDSGTPDVQRFFLEERKRLAIQWLRMTQSQVNRLMDLHLKLAAYTSEPSPRFEFRLIINFLWFILASNGLLALFWLRGPFEAVRVVGYTLCVSEYFWQVFRLRIEKVDPVRLSAAGKPRLV